MQAYIHTFCTPSLRAAAVEAVETSSTTLGKPLSPAASSLGAQTEDVRQKQQQPLGEMYDSRVAY